MSLFDIVSIEIQLSELEKETLSEEFWQKAPNETGKVLVKIKQLKSKVQQYRTIEAEILNLEDLTELANMENDEEVAKDILKSTSNLEKDIEKLQ